MGGQNRKNKKNNPTLPRDQAKLHFVRKQFVPTHSSNITEEFQGKNPGKNQAGCDLYPHVSAGIGLVAIGATPLKPNVAKNRQVMEPLDRLKTTKAMG
jgi:hypothetical protein